MLYSFVHKDYFLTLTHSQDSWDGRDLFAAEKGEHGNWREEAKEKGEEGKVMRSEKNKT